MATRKREKDEPKRWSAGVTHNSNALDLDAGVFTWNSPVAIARSLKHSAETSRRRKGTPYQSAASMLNFYINRAGKNLPASRRRVLEQARLALRKAFGRPPAGKPAETGRKTSNRNGGTREGAAAHRST
jgi:hypothetical protein